jgi:hypothetical protein
MWYSPSWASALRLAVLPLTAPRSGLLWPGELTLPSSDNARATMVISFFIVVSCCLMRPAGRVAEEGSSDNGM